MHSITLLYLLSFFYIWNSHNFAQAAIDQSQIYTLSSDELLTSDYTRLESQLEALKTDNEFFKLRFEMIQSQLDKQGDILQRFEQKFDKIPQRIESIESNIRGQINENFGETNDLIREIVKDHNVLFETLSKKLKNVENILNKASSETSTCQLGESISKDLTLLQSIDKKLTNVDTITTNQNKIIEKYLDQTEATRICLKTDDQKLVCITQKYPTNCADFNTNYCTTNKCRILNQLCGPQPFWVACDDQTDGGGWTVIQRRIDGSVDFYRGWSEYKNGFGSIDGEFFIGLDKLHALTNTLGPMELLIQLRDFNDTVQYAKYDEFVVGNETENYILSKVGKYSGDTKDSFSPHQGYSFSTYDRDNDIYYINCAKKYMGGWWYDNCFWSNLNGKYYGSAEAGTTKNGICWNGVKGCEYSLKFVQMMIRPKKRLGLKKNKFLINNL